MRTATRASYLERIQEVVDHVLDHLDAPLDVAELAERACFSRWHFSRIFSAIVGESLQEFVRRIRLERSAWSLRRTRSSICEIAFDAGYATHEAFTKAFRAAYGSCPSEYRRSGRDSYWIDAPSRIHYASQDAGYALVLRTLGGHRMEVAVKKMPALRAVCMRHVGPYDQIGQKFEEFFSWVKANAAPATTPIAFYLDDPGSTPASELRSDAGALVPADYTTDDPRVHIVDLPPKEFAIYTHVGPYEQLGEAWGKFAGEWFPASGREMEGSVCFELYVDDPCTTPPEKLRTELYEAVKPL